MTAMRISFICVFALLFVGVIAFTSYSLTHACDQGQGCGSQAHPHPAPIAHYLTSPTGDRIAVWCDYSHGNLIYENTTTGSLTAIQNACPLIP